MKETVVSCIEHEDCTGCGACANICPNNAVTLNRDTNGFLKRFVDEDKCTNCGLCISHCPLNGLKYINTPEPECYAVWAPDNIRKVSSSGGVFSVLAYYFMDCGGYIAGVVYNDDFSTKHILGNDYQSVLNMRGSKYIQSDIGNVYKEIKEKLESGNKVLFTGMPCQIAGLYSYLKEEYEFLYTVELVCHGITSYSVFEKYKKDVFGDKEIRTIDYKKKTPWGWHAGINAEFVDNTEYRKPAESDPYFQAYLNGISKSKTCATCKFNRLPRQADLTIGDFWKIGKFDENLNDNLGTSLVLINNLRGKELFNSVRNNFQKCNVVPLKYALAGNGSLREPYKNHMRNKKFFEELNDINFEKLVNHCLQNRFDVGIVGLWYGLNYGSILTYYALYRVVGKMGFDAIMVNKPNFIWRPLYDDFNTIANRFIRNHCTVSSLHKYQDFPLLNDHCDIFIVGSDVVWNYEICGKEGGNFFYLDFVNDTKKKIAYASSFGGEYNATETERYMNQYYMQKFDAVSVREDAAVDICKNEFGVEAQKVLDPVFLCDFSVFDELANEAEVDLKNEFVMTYILGGNEQQRNIILEIAGKLKCNQLINIPNPNNPKRVKEALQLQTPEEQPSVEEWLYYMKNAKFFIGDSFHGLCFAIIFKKPFIIAISKSMPSKDRFLTLLELCGLENRLLYLEDDNNNIDQLLFDPIDYESVYSRLENYKAKSWKWLESSLKKEKVHTIIEKPQFESNWYQLAKTAYENAHNRQIVTWGSHPEFTKALKEYFHIDIPFWVAKNLDLVNGKSIKAFSVLKDNKDKYYLVIPSNIYKPSDAQILNDYGYLEIKDYIYYNHRAVEISSGNYNKKYFDAYGNKIKGDIPKNFKIVFRGWGNIVDFGKDIEVQGNVNLNMNSNGECLIGDKCRFVNHTFIDFFGQQNEGFGSVLKIRDNCIFDGTGKIALFANPEKNANRTELLLNKHCTFGTNFDLRVSSGRKVIIGEDCMFSHNISIQAGDGHAIFDVKTGKRTNITNFISNSSKECLVLGDHIWIGKNVMLLENTNVGMGSIIGANSVVKGRYPNNCAIGGNIAQVIRRDVAWSRNNGTYELGTQEKRYALETKESNPPLSGKKVLVVGGTRFMGKELVKELIKLGNDVTIATRGYKKDTFGNEIKRIKMDISDANSVEKALKGKYFDVVFDNLAYCSNYVKNILMNVKTTRYVQLSSIMVYKAFKPYIKEELFIPTKEPFSWCSRDVGYGAGKRSAECAVYQNYCGISSVTVRIPSVTPTERLEFFCENIWKQIPMSLPHLEAGLTFVESKEVGKFLPWIATQNFEGPINLASSGMITIKMIIEYIEAKTGKKAIIDNSLGVEAPFNFYNGTSFSLDISAVEKLGYHTSSINEWFWDVLDDYIDRTINRKEE